MIETTPTKSGRSGRIRRASRPPSTSPTPIAASTRPHTEAPPSDSFATTGPRTLRPADSAALAKAKPSTTTQIQVRERNSRQPVPELADEAHGGLALGGPDVHRQQDRRGDEVRQRVEGDRPPRPGGGDEQAAECGAADVRGVEGQAQQRVRGLQLVGRDGLRHDPLRGREEEGARDRPHDGDHRELPDLGPAREQEVRRDRLGDPGDEVRRRP